MEIKEILVSLLPPITEVLAVFIMAIKMLKSNANVQAFFYKVSNKNITYDSVINNINEKVELIEKVCNSTIINCTEVINDLRTQNENLAKENITLKEENESLKEIAKDLKSIKQQNAALLHDK